MRGHASDRWKDQLEACIHDLTSHIVASMNHVLGLLVHHQLWPVYICLHPSIYSP
jgi:hypothetical protein